MLRVELIGNLGGAAEQRFTQQGRALTQLRVAVNQRRPRPDGDSEETTTWFGVRAMGTLGERCATLDKGTRVLVIGRHAGARRVFRSALSVRSSSSRAVRGEGK